MEQITRKEGVIYYGVEPCKTVEDAYRRFRDDYHKALGKCAYRRLNRLGSRMERVHGFHSYFRTGRSEELRKQFGGTGKVRCRLLGIVGASYCYIIGAWEWPDYDEDTLWNFFDWLLDNESKALTVVGRQFKTGRTAKKRKRFR